ncbi:MAG: hypothetical protein PHX78_05500 [bacterium]|nr:hypothetical protein [bacterium]
MKKAVPNNTLKKDDLKAEYNFSNMKGAVRGKYYKAYREGHNVIIHQTDGSVSVKYFKLEDGAVMIEPDVKKYFPNSESVNKALRSLIDIVSSKNWASAHTK